MRANVLEVMFSRVTKPIQIKHHSKKSTDTELKSIVGLTTFYCQLTSRAQVLVMCLKLKRFKFDLKKNLSLEFVSSLCIGSVMSVKGVVLKSFTSWNLGPGWSPWVSIAGLGAILAISLPEEVSKSFRFLTPHNQTESQLLHASVGY